MNDCGRGKTICCVEHEAGRSFVSGERNRGAETERQSRVSPPEQSIYDIMPSVLDNGSRHRWSRTCGEDESEVCEVGHRTLDRSPTDAQREVCPTCPIFHLKALAGAFGQYMKRVFGIEVVSRGKKGAES